MTNRTVLSLLTILLNAAMGCTGTIGDPGGSGPGGPGNSGNPGLTGSMGSTGTSGTTGNPGITGGNGTGITGGMTGNPTMPPDPNAAGQMPMRRLNRREYNNTVRDLLAVQTNPADAFPLDTEAGFIFHRAGQVASLDASRLQEAAEAISAGVNPATLAPCTAGATGAAEEACVRKFITTFGLKAYRRPPLPAEADRLFALFQTGRTTLALDYAGGIRLVVEAILQSPPFVYRWELGPSAATLEGSVARLGPYEMASRLSYFLWRSMPDQALFDAALANKLATDADVDAQARRMVADPKAQDTVNAFFSEWLSLEQVVDRPKDAMLYPQWNDALKAAMTAETQAFVKNVVFDGDGRLDTLLTANFSFLNQPLAAVYGVTGVTGTATQQKQLNAMQRAGLLTQAGFLTVTGASDGSNPVKRGRKVYERLLCGTLPPPPPNVPPAKPASAGGTTRERFMEHDQQACAQACHSLMDPIGYGFEHYDGIGAFRTMDNGKPVDSSSSITLDGAVKKFADAIELTGLLAASTDVRNCVVVQFARFALLRDDTPADLASLNAAAATFASANFNVRELLVGIAKSRTFRYRSLAAGEVQP